MENAINTLKKVGICPPDILIPQPHIDLKKWAVVACDQYTSQKEYWESVAQFVSDDPSTLHLIYPEVYLEEKNPEKRIESINAKMSEYLENNIFSSYPSSFFLVKRDIENTTRWGLMISLDLECYDYAKDSKTPIRATEGTIESRIPPRKLIRKDAPLELPHILVLISDEERSIIEPFAQQTQNLQQVYDTDLMKGGGHISGYAINNEEHIQQLAQRFTALFNKADKENPLVYAMGDGNHSLATARSCWLDIKKGLSTDEIEDHPARYALVEIENIYDEGLAFEAIHRVLFNTSKELFIETLSHYCDEFEINCVDSIGEMMTLVDENSDAQTFGYNDKDGYYVITLTNAHSTLAAGTLQSVIDELLEKHIEGLSVDYIHGIDVTGQLGEKEGNIGIFLPAIDKNTFFEAIVKDGALPRKTFSMGEAHEKRFYMEARKIQ
jgi:hypothetical protein